MADKAQKKKFRDLEVPNPGELDVLGVLWAERRGSDSPLQLSEIHRRVCERRRAFGEVGPALSTVSGHLQRLADKDLIETTARASTSPLAPPVRVRGGYTPPSRSPLTSYRAKHTPGEVLHKEFVGLIAAYPADDRFDALLDMAKALDLPDELLLELRRLLEAHKARECRRPAGRE